MESKCHQHFSEDSRFPVVHSYKYFNHIFSYNFSQQSAFSHVFITKLLYVLRLREILNFD